ncbi:MAG: DEAD/DEAH box helicase, partial [Desulfovibrio sp.]|nr:DEAD/DEAH box helicase [Desulfovibrio sp.]
MGRQIVRHRLFPAVPPEYGENVRPWSTAIASLLGKRNIRLYSHQALASDYIRAGKSVVVATPTASGKSLVYNLPVLETFLKDPDSRALYLFPLKALAQDQLQAFRSLTADWPEAARPAIGLYDGDTPDQLRKKIRNEPPAVLLSNPEMLHLALLPYHENWTTFLANLNYIIVDEAHTYRGLFGAHMAHVFRRLNRVCAHYGASPTYVFCTATLGNPRELAGTLMDGKPELIDKSGAGRGPRHFLFVNPDAAPSTCVIDLLRRALEKNLRTIVYCKTRRMTELISLWAGAADGPYKGRISAYRAGFLPEERREIEARMASGDLLAVVSTSALELGIDIGGLDLCILVGYPGTIMQTLQRGGRVGRAGNESAVMVVAGEDALDQYFMRNPDDFFSRPPEKAVINPDNEIIAARHLECAATELPLKEGEPAILTEGGKAALSSLLASRRLARAADGSRYVATRLYPQRDIDLRGAGRSYHIEDENGRIIGFIDGYRAWQETHPGAVYIHRGKRYLIEDIDDGRMRITAKSARADWFTNIRSHKTTDILEEYERISLGRCPVFRGRLRITDFITGYEKRSVSGRRLLSITPLEAPPRIFETEGIWIVIPDAVRESLEKKFLHFMGSIHALEHAVIGMLPLEVLADRGDFGGISIPLHPQLGMGAVFLYDSLPGGAGLTRAAFGDTRGILQ